MLRLVPLAIVVSLGIGQAPAQSRILRDLTNSNEKAYVTNAKKLSRNFLKWLQSYQKDSTRLVRQMTKEGKSQNEIEELSQTLRTHYNLSEYEEASEAYQLYKEDKKKFRQQVFAKSRRLADQELSEKVGEYDQIKELEGAVSPYAQEFKRYSAYLSNPDSFKTVLANQTRNLEKLIEQKAMGFEEVAELKKQEESLKSMMELPNEVRQRMQSRVVKLKQPLRLKDQIPGSTEELGQEASDKATEVTQEKSNAVLQEQEQQFRRNITKKLDKAIAKQAGLKKKYRSYFQSNGEIVKVKHSSLKDASPIERFTLGGNLKINRQEHITVDFSPIIGYRLNRVLTIGAGGSYRLDLGNESWSFNDSTTVSEIKGYNAFIRHALFKNYFAELQFENLQLEKTEESPNTDTEIKSHEWAPSLKAGFGKQYRLKGFIDGTVMVLYDFNYSKSTTPFRRRWQVKFGFQLNGERAKVIRNRKKNIKRVLGR